MFSVTVRKRILICLFILLFVLYVTFLLALYRSRPRSDGSRIPFDPLYFQKVANCTIRYEHRSSSHSKDSCLCEVHIGDEHKKKYQRMTENKRAYARQHDMDYVMLETSPYPELNPAMHKISFLRYLLETTTYEWLILIDSDTIFTNTEQTFDAFRKSDVDIVVHVADVDTNKTAEDTMFVQGSAYMVRNCPLMKEFLDEVWHSICIETLPFNFDSSRDDWGEQSHVQKIVRKMKYAQRCHYLTGYDFQCLAGGKGCANVCIDDDHRPLLAHPIKTQEDFDDVFNGNACSSKKTNDGYGLELESSESSPEGVLPWNG